MPRHVSPSPRRTRVLTALGQAQSLARIHYFTAPIFNFPSSHLLPLLYSTASQMPDSDRLNQIVSVGNNSMRPSNNHLRSLNSIHCYIDGGAPRHRTNTPPHRQNAALHHPPHSSPAMATETTPRLTDKTHHRAIATLTDRYTHRPLPIVRNYRLLVAISGALSYVYPAHSANTMNKSRVFGLY
jgi:hypothetical protein